MECLSNLPGRVRFKSLDIYYNTDFSEYIEKYTNSLYGVKYTKVTKNTGSILILYDIHKTTLQILKENIENALSCPLAKDDARLKNFDKYFDSVKNRKAAKIKFLFWSTFYLVLKIKSSIYGKFSASKNLNVLKVTSLVTIIGGYPLLKKLYKKLAKSIPTDEDILLELTALSFTILRESSRGVLVLMFKALNDYIKFSSEVESRKALLDSSGYTYRMAWVKSNDDNNILISLDSLKIGDYIYVYKGEVVPAEGIIEDGNALINTLYFTGQSTIFHSKKGRKIYEGTAIISGYLKIKITTLPQLTEKVDISPKKLYIHNRTKGFQDKMTPVALIASSLSSIFTNTILSAFSTLLALSPKASSVALNSGIKNYISLLNKNHIYLRNPNTFENILNVNKIMFDKTGTLTYGKMKIISIDSFDDNYSEMELLKICATCEYENFHPISVTLKDTCKNIDINKIDSSVLIPSEGVKANYNSNEVLIGNKKLMENNNIDLSKGNEQYINYQNKFLIPIFIAINQKLVGIIVLDDILRNDSKDLINRLKYNNINDLSIITGDSNVKAKQIGNQLGITKIYSSVNYFEKADIVKYEGTHNTVMMIGDGINDVLAMKAADISISFANSSCNKVKLHSDCIIYDNDLTKITDLISLSQKSYSAITRTILFSNLYNVVLGLIAFCGNLNVFTAKSLNTLNSLLVLLLNQRIRYIKPNKIDDRFYLKQNDNPIKLLN